MKQITIDATGKPCPIPVIEAKKALQELGNDSGIIEVLVDNQVAIENIQKMASGKKIPTESKIIAADKFSIFLKKPALLSEEDLKKSEFVVIFGKDHLGEGSEELGEIMVKSYIYSLTELPQIPTQLFFYHGGIFLTNEKSPVLADLKRLEEMGTKISSCGACLDFYDLKEELAVGDITNMYTISSGLAAADKLITF